MNPIGFILEVPTELRMRRKPVSYTHLDVYKRQDYRRYDCRRSKGMIAMKIMIVEDEENIRAVSYTHLVFPYVN